MTKVRKDKYGLYVRAGGYLFRPYEAKYSYYIAHALNCPLKGESHFSEGQEVKAAHRACTPFGVVKKDEYVEWWHSHGMYFEKKSEECWEPK
jgi:hypothetical protein